MNNSTNTEDIHIMEALGRAKVVVKKWKSG